MKDIVITSQRIKKELYILLGCFFIAFIVNILSIIIYKTRWNEVFTQLGYVVVISLALYLFVGVIRIVLSFILRAIKK